MPRFREFHLQLPHITLDNSKNLRWLYCNRVIRDLVNKLVYFFFPIFLFQYGQSNAWFVTTLSAVQLGFLIIAGYFLLARGVNAISLIFFGQLVRKYGHKQALVGSYILRLVHFTFLLFSLKQPLLLIMAAAFDGLQSALFWPSYHTILSKQTSKRSLGGDLGVLHFLLQVAQAIAPAFAGLVAITLGFPALFLFGLLGSILGLITAMFLEKQNDPDKVSIKEFLNWLKERRYLKFTLAVGSRYMSDVVLFIWPLYLFLLFGSIDKVGYLYTSALFLSIIITVILTIKLDKLKSKHYFSASGSILSLFWLARINMVSVWGIALLDAFDRIVANFHWLFFDLLWYKRGKGSQAHSYFVYSDLVQQIAMCFTWVLIVIIFLVSSLWQTLFIIAALATVLSTLMQSKHEGTR